ncbi:MAG: hypothetical protein KGY67_05560 [Candidatus Thermoplasmatota archaeon]|nr:hypothetical protein [Candidatus Thermoplasmatota archaeon]
MLPQIRWFQQLASFSKKHCSFLIPHSERTKNRLLSFWDEDYDEAVHFTGLHVSKEAVLALAYTVFLSSFLVLFSIDLGILLLYYFLGVPFDVVTIVFMVLATILIPFLLMQLVVSYPKTLVTYAQIHSLGDIPEVLSYLVMSLKLTPNLEQSLSFTAKESSNSLVWDLRKLIWDINIRVHYGVNDAISKFASRWGRYSEAFKRSLHLIRSSVDEPDEAQRMMTLNKALDVGLEGTRDMMRAFADQLHQPIMVIYSIGIMIPLSIIAMLPAAGLIGLHITIFQVFFVYDLLLPLVLFLYMRSVLLHRPATFSPPHIAYTDPRIVKMNKKKIALVAVSIGFLISIPGLLYIIAILISSVSVLPVFSQIMLFNETVPMSLFLLWGFVIGFFVYARLAFTSVHHIRKKIKHMEKEFSDALYIIGKRLHEGKSPEESLSYTAETLKGSVISDLFSETVFVLSARQATIEMALFHPEFGSLKNVYSNRINAVMKLFVEGIKKSQRSASLSIIRLADHLKALQEVEKHIRETLATLTATLRSTATLFAPLIAGVTLAITQLISTIVEQMMLTSNSSSLFAMEDTMMPGITTAFALENIEPTWFILVIGIYIIELVILLTRFTNGIEDGDDHVSFMYDLGRVLPVAMLVLTISIFLSSMFLGSLAISL